MQQIVYIFVCGHTNGKVGIAAKKINLFFQHQSFVFLKIWVSPEEISSLYASLMYFKETCSFQYSPLVSLEISAQIKNLSKKLKWRSQDAWLAPDGEGEFDENP